MSDTNKMSKYYQHSTFTLRVFKYAAVLVFIIFLISCIVIFRKDITVENIQLLAKYISIDSSSSDYTDEFSITANDDSNIVMLRNNLGVVNNNNISLYDLSGQKLFSYNFSLSSPAVVHDAHSIVVYDIKGNTLTVFNSFSKIKDFKYSGHVLSADINDNYLSVITEDESYNSLLKLYQYSNHERDFVDVFTLKSTNFLTSSAVSHNGRYIIASSADSNEGSYRCGIHVYDTTSNASSPLYSKDIDDELPIKVGFADDNESAFVITDSGIHFYDNKLENSSTYKFNLSKVENFYENNNMIIITERNNLSGNSVMLTGLSKYGDLLFEINISDVIYDINIGNEKILALGKQNVYEITRDKDDKYIITGSQELSAKCFSVVTDTNDNCYVLSDSTVTKINFDK